MTALTKRLESGKCADLPAAVKTDLETAIAAVKTNLDATSTQLGAATSVEQVKVLNKDVVLKNRVFIHFVPATNGMCLAARLQQRIDDKILPRLEEAAAKGVDTTELTTLIESAKTAASEAYVLYKKVATTPGSDLAKADLEAANKKMQEARKNLADAKQAVQRLVTPSNDAAESTETDTPTTPNTE